MDGIILWYSGKSLAFSPCGHGVVSQAACRAHYTLLLPCCPVFHAHLVGHDAWLVQSGLPVHEDNITVFQMTEYLRQQKPSKTCTEIFYADKEYPQNFL